MHFSVELIWCVFCIFSSFFFLFFKRATSFVATFSTVAAAATMKPFYVAWRFIRSHHRRHLHVQQHHSQRGLQALVRYTPLVTFFCCCCFLFFIANSFVAASPHLLPLQWQTSCVTLFSYNLPVECCCHSCLAY